MPQYVHHAMRPASQYESWADMGTYPSSHPALHVGMIAQGVAAPLNVAESQQLHVSSWCPV